MWTGLELNHLIGPRATQTNDGIYEICKFEDIQNKI